MGCSLGKSSTTSESVPPSSRARTETAQPNPAPPPLPPMPSPEKIAQLASDPAAQQSSCVDPIVESAVHPFSRAVSELERLSTQYDVYATFGLKASDSLETAMRRRNRLARHYMPKIMGRVNSPAEVEQFTFEMGRVNEMYSRVLKTPENRAVYNRLTSLRKLYGSLPRQDLLGLTHLCEETLERLGEMDALSFPLELLQEGEHALEFIKELIAIRRTPLLRNLTQAQMEEVICRLSLTDFDNGEVVSSRSPNSSSSSSVIIVKSGLLVGELSCLSMTSASSRASLNSIEPSLQRACSGRRLSERHRFSLESTSGSIAIDAEDSSQTLLKAFEGDCIGLGMLVPTFDHSANQQVSCWRAALDNGLCGGSIECLVLSPSAVDTLPPEVLRVMRTNASDVLNAGGQLEKEMGVGYV